MEKYYFKTSGWDNATCVEKCKIKDCMIGSVTCQECENCVETSTACIHTKTINWIKCKKLKEAIGK